MLVLPEASKKGEHEIGRKKDEAAAQPQSTPGSKPAETPAMPAEKIEPKKEANTAAGGGAGGDEEDGGYESCPDMTPEQLAKIANESPAK
ncbi:unnamed protein product [Litomosoides sigmodontis]|uniref:Uncharacterized protein n=1 Tax=Litomosoides sigmodontis TaxID=42156 RepID=A0A3P6TPQ7_LITSI|nr:unnamed protein product [Litomosoides sigmodontis]